MNCSMIKVNMETQDELVEIMKFNKIFLFRYYRLVKRCTSTGTLRRGFARSHTDFPDSSVVIA